MELRDKVRFSTMTVAAGLLALAQRPAVLLLVAIALYICSEPLLGVVPLKPHELSEVLAGAKEATIAAAGLVVAIASISAFKHAKRLDLELAVSADISAINSDAIKVLTRYGFYCEKIIEIKNLFAARYDPLMSPSARKELDEHLAVEWQLLLRWAKEIDVERDAIWSLIRRILELAQKHQAIIGSRIITPILLERAQVHLEAIANAASFPVPDQDQELLEYIRAFMLYGVPSVQNYQQVELMHKVKFLGYFGAASSIGSNSIAPRSLVTAGRMVWKLMRL